MPAYRIGGSFAPRLDAEKITAYRELANSASPEIADAMLKLCDMVESFYETPESQMESKPHPLGMLRFADGKVARAPAVIPLEDAEIERISDQVPWQHEVDMYKQLFGSIPNDSQKELRDAAFHLVWYAQELTLDREPLTADKIQVV